MATDKAFLDTILQQKDLSLMQCQKGLHQERDRHRWDIRNFVYIKISVGFSGLGINFINIYPSLSLFSISTLFNHYLHSFIREIFFHLIISLVVKSHFLLKLLFSSLPSILIFENGVSALLLFKLFPTTILFWARVNLTSEHSSLVMHIGHLIR